MTTFKLTRDELGNKNYAAANAVVVDDTICDNHEAVIEIILNILKEENYKD